MITLERIQARITRGSRLYGSKVKRLHSNDRNWLVTPRQTRKVFLPNPNKPKIVPEKKINSPSFEKKIVGRTNEIGIQMLSSHLYKEIFKGYNAENVDGEVLSRCKEVLEKHSMVVQESDFLKDVNLKLPELKGNNLEEHFQAIGEEQAAPYRTAVLDLIQKGMPDRPIQFVLQEGWTRYSRDGKIEKVNYPEGNCLVFDVEVCVKSSQAPIIATAVSSEAWYSWVSRSLIDCAEKPITNEVYSLDMFIPIESCNRDEEASQKSRVVVGHNVCYDRTRVREQYLLEKSAVRFIDTMSLHIAISGLTSYQRAMLKSMKSDDDSTEESDSDMWMKYSSLNSLAEVYKLYYKSELSKSTRDIFVEGTIKDVAENFQECMYYCSGDTQATFNILKKLFPLFLQRFPHPVTLAGILELGTGYLPVNSNWHRYINNSEQTYEDLDIESKLLLVRRADQACQLLHEARYRKDIWMWDQDWEVKELRLKKETKASSSKRVVEEKKVAQEVQCLDEDLEEDPLEKKFQELFENVNRLPAKIPLLVGYPNWYRKLCTKPDSSPTWVPSPHLISTSMQVTPKLLSLMWKGYPLHYIREHGWGFLVPFSDDFEIDRQVPLKEILEKCPLPTSNKNNSANQELHSFYQQIEKNIGSNKKGRFLQDLQKEGAEIIVEDCCYFIKLPHKNGPQFRVGNPLAKDFLNKFSENVLSGDTESAERVLAIARQLSYWRNNRDRIKEQIVVRLSSEDDISCIIPQIVVCGTLTRRAVEPTWMTASNASSERVGSELRAMVQAPDNYCFVGADVDSQELWIASVIGDAFHARTHGCTPLGWMTLSGTKALGTDMHSVTAKAVGISRDHAKVINYARIYGAGQKFAERLLKQFNPNLSDGEAKSKASKMFTFTKGKQIYKLKKKFQPNFERTEFTKYEAFELAKLHNASLDEMFYRPVWRNGTESAMFNRLEEIANMPFPKTPFLNASLSRALEAINSDQYLPTRINWVVQSGAVDFLHLLLVSMRWLMKDKARFCLSFHDEIRYLVKEEHKYEAALAMHLSNLLTRSFCCVKLGLYDLPASVAFFSSVEVDKVLRKDASNDCVTPSNPHGLEKGYKIPPGESLDIYQTLKKLYPGT